MPKSHQLPPGLTDPGNQFPNPPPSLPALASQPMWHHLLPEEEDNDVPAGPPVYSWNADSGWWTCLLCNASAQWNHMVSNKHKRNYKSYREKPGAWRLPIAIPEPPPLAPQPPFGMPPPAPGHWQWGGQQQHFDTAAQPSADADQNGQAQRHAQPSADADPNTHWRPGPNHDDHQAPAGTWAAPSTEAPGSQPPLHVQVAELTELLERVMQSMVRLQTSLAAAMATASQQQGTSTSTSTSTPSAANGTNGAADNTTSTSSNSGGDNVGNNNGSWEFM